MTEDTPATGDPDPVVSGADDPNSSGVDDSDPDTAGADPPQITPAELQERVDARDPVRVLDLRNRDEVERWAIAGPSVTHTQTPHNRFVQARVTDSIDEFVDDIEGEGPVTVVCARGEASAAVAEHLDEAGYDAHNLAGGMEAWARLLTATDLDADLPGDGTVVQYRRPSSGCLGYAVVSGGEAAVVDPLATMVDRYVADAEERGVEITHAVDTHVHADHVSGVRDLAAATGAEPVLPERAAERGVTFDVTTVADGDQLDVGAATLEAVAAPGHTTGMTAFAVAAGDDGRDATDGPVTLLTGDSLFVESVARPDLERGAEGARELARGLYRTLTERFARFPDGTVVAPGHHGEGTRPDGDGRVMTTLGYCRDLPVFGLDVDGFVEYVTDDMPPRPANFERVIAVNLGRETVDDETAFELELGPNNCAATPAAGD